MKKVYISAQQLLEDSFDLALKIYESGFRPDYIVGVWRGGAPVGIAVQELLHVLGVESDHIAIRTSSYSGIGERRKNVKVHGLTYLIKRLESEDSLLIVDDVHDTGLSIEQTVLDIERACKKTRRTFASPRPITSLTIIKLSAPPITTYIKATSGWSFPMSWTA